MNFNSASKLGQSLVSLLIQPQGVTQMSPGVDWEKERWITVLPTALVAFSSWSYISNSNFVKMQWSFPWAGTLGKQAGFIPTKIRQNTCPLHPQTIKILTMQHTSSLVLSANPGETKASLLLLLLELRAHGGLPAISVGLGELMTLQGFIMIICKFFSEVLSQFILTTCMGVGTLALFSRWGA